jgi:hypothetical protein
MNGALTQIVNSGVGELTLVVEIYALVLSVLGVLFSTRRLAQSWRTRYIRKVWGIKDGDYVAVVCSELDEPDSRQNLEPREFIYNLKYGDLDAYFEVVVTLLRLFPNVKLRLVSAGEVERTRVDMARHLILIGGPDYNPVAARFMEMGITRMRYRSPHTSEPSKTFPTEIVLLDAVENREYCELTDQSDYGYFERVSNPHDPDKNVIFVGGSHTVGVTGAIKAFSLAESERGELPRVVLLNSEKVARKVKKHTPFAVVVRAERVGQNISTPVVSDGDIKLGKLEEHEVRIRPAQKDNRRRSRPAAG